MDSELLPDTETNIMSKKFEIEGALLAHGIELVSRHGILREMQEMLAFAELAGRSWVGRYLKGIFYDSGSCCASFEFHVQPGDNDPVLVGVAAIADQTLSQFELYGMIHHGQFVPVEKEEVVSRVPAVLVETVQ